MPNSLYLINARASSPSYWGADIFAHFGFAPAQGIADLAAVTVAALAPAHWDISVCDEHLAPVDFDHPATYVGITGKVSQAARMLELAAALRRRGKIVLMGGPSVSLSPEAFRGQCDILVIGELESAAPELFADLERGSWKDEYVGERVDLALSPVPRWDLYPTERALSASVQTSRGCPFECEFCDVIQYLGRRSEANPPHRFWPSWMCSTATASGQFFWPTTISPSTVVGPRRSRLRYATGTGAGQRVRSPSIRKSP